MGGIVSYPGTGSYYDAGLVYCMPEFTGAKAFLDLTVNRNLYVKGRIIQPVTGWIQYTPTIIAYSTLAGRGAASPVAATGIVYTSFGRWNQIGSIVVFDFNISITTKGTNFVSNPYVNLPPPKPLNSFTAQGITQPNGNTDDSKVNQLFGYARPGATQILVGPSSYSTPTVLPNLTFPLQFMVSGSYEATL